MRKRHGALTVLLALACNEVLGLDAGIPKDERGGGGSFSGSSGEGGAALGTSNASGNGGSTAGTGYGGIGGNDSNGGSANNGGEGAAVSCSTTADCIEEGLAWPPYLCLAGACVDVLTEECDAVLGAEWLERHPEDQPIVFGAVTEDVDELSASYWSLELAMREFTEHGSVPIDGIEQRPVLLVCGVPAADPDPTPRRRALDHLIDDIGVPGVLMLESRPELLALVQYAFGDKKADVFFIDVGGGNAELLERTLDDGRLWHMLGDEYSIGWPFVPLVALVEEHVNPGASTGESARLTRVVMVPPAEDDGFESRIAPAVEGVIRTNNRWMVDYSDTYRMVSARNRFNKAAREVADFEPDIVIDFAGLYSDVDASARYLGGALPFYILPPSQARSPLLRERIASDPSLRTRIVGLNDAGPDDEHKPLYDAYLERFAAIAPAGVDASASANVYEATYFLVYAAVAGGTGGSNMNAGMTRLLGLLTNSRRDIGPTTIDSVIDLLNSDPTLSLHGALGPPSFDPYSGGRGAASTVWCINERLEFVPDVLRPKNQLELVGTFPCFDL